MQKFSAIACLLVAALCMLETSFNGFAMVQAINVKERTDAKSDLSQ